MRRLAKTVTSGGVLYPAGGTVPDEVAARITADVWADNPDPIPNPAPVEQASPKPRGRRTAKKG